MRRSILKSLGNPFGFTLTEVVMAAAIMSVIIYVAMSSLVGAFKQQADIVQKDNVHQFTRSLMSYLNNQNYCTQELQGITFPVDSSTPIALRNYRGYGASDTEIKAEAQLNDRMIVTGLDLVHKASVPTQTIGTGTNLSKVYVAQVKLSLNVPTGTGYTPSKPSFIEFPIVTDADNVITSCQVGFNIANACYAMGMELDPVTNECIPQTNCLVTGTYVLTSCTPSTYGCDSTYNTSNPVTGGKSCPSDSSPRLTGELVYNTTVSCGKKCTTNVENQTRFFLCMKCS